MKNKTFDKNQFIDYVQEREKDWIAIDFDGVIYKNSLGFHDGTLYDKPLPGSHKGLKELSKRYNIVIYTCKANPSRPTVEGKNGIELVKEWLKLNNMWQFVSEIVWGKPNVKFYIDDKCIRFFNWEQLLEDVRSFENENK
ncbi:MAG: hypothetical protein VW646_01380 [Hydrogenophilales bacterium]